MRITKIAFELRLEALWVTLYTAVNCKGVMMKFKTMRQMRSSKPYYTDDELVGMSESYALYNLSLTELFRRDKLILNR